MKLKHVELYGFKSFADKTRLTFDKDISAVVGPNGSGKSNIADAIKWVLGEQSAKSLRGSSMQDVIFAGSQSKKPMNMAHVSLVLDNSDKSLPIAYDEVNVTRRVFRTGESEYLLNKSPVKLKDIRELFLDTGVGKDGYSLIGQGRIDEILSGRPEKRREIFEEASGIAKNKYKKSQAERRLERNEENLKKLNSEIKIKKQEFDILEKQATNAKEGMRLTNKLETLELSLLKQSISKSDTDLENDKSKLEYIDSNLLENQEEYNKISVLLDPVQEKIKDQEEELNLLKEEAISRDKDIQRYNSELTLFDEKINFFNNDLARFENDIKIRKERIENNKERKELLNKNNNEFLEKRTKKQAEISDLEDKIRATNLELEEKNKDFNLSTSILRDKKDQLAKLLVDKNTKVKLDDSNSKLLENYKSEISKLDSLIKDKNKDLSRKESEREDLEKQVKNTDELKISLDVSINDKLEKLKNIEEQILDKRQDYLKIESERNILDRQYKSYDGYYRSVQDLLKIADKNEDINDKIIGVLADLIYIDDKYKEALDVALGSALQNIVIDNEDDGKYLIDFLKRKGIGRITFLPISKIKGYKKTANHDLVIDNLNNLVNHDSRIEQIIDYYLANTLLVKDMNDAVKVSKDLKGFRIITLDGDVINSWGSMVGGKNFKKSNNTLVNRKKEIDKLSTKLKKTGGELKKLNDFYHELNQEIKVDKDELSANNDKVNDLLAKIQEVKSIINETNIEIKFNSERKNELLLSLEEVKEKLKAVDYSSLNDLEDEIKNQESELEILAEEISKLNTNATSFDKDLIRLKADSDVIERDINHNSIELENLEIDMDNDISANNTDEKNLAYTKEQIKSLENKKENNISKLESLNAKSNNNELIATLVKEIESLKSNFETDRIKLDQIKNAIAEAEKEKYKIELKITNNKEKIQNLRDDYLSTYGIDDNDLDEKLANLLEVNTSKKEVNDIKMQLSKIGYFNYESISQFELVSEDLDFMTKQYDDLLVSKEDISSLIKSIEKEMVEEFKKSFKLIREKFNEIFQILFDGGEADLKLDSEDVLTAGVEIIARPEGKSLKSIDLLSGGERSMTAVALLFAIFEINPAPFCVLDEIDAALDEANIRRYIDYLKSLTDRTQFIIITHRKTTMEMAEILYGVTMEEQGISKVITLALDDYSWYFQFNITSHIYWLVI